MFGLVHMELTENGKCCFDLHRLPRSPHFKHGAHVGGLLPYVIAVRGKQLKYSHRPTLHRTAVCNKKA